MAAGSCPPSDNDARSAFTALPRILFTLYHIIDLAQSHNSMALHASVMMMLSMDLEL